MEYPLFTVNNVDNGGTIFPMEPKPMTPKPVTGTPNGAIPLPSAAKATGGNTPKKNETGDKWKQWVWALIALLIVAGVVYFLGKNEAEAPAPVEEGEEQAMQETIERRGPSLLWEFAPAGGDPTTGAYKTQVMLVVNGETRDLGIYDGSCMIVDGSGAWPLVEGEVTGVICWWAGVGHEIGVFHDAGTYVVKKGLIEQAMDTARETRGDFEALFTI